MSDTVSNLLNQALALPLPERFELAQSLWSSLQESDASEAAEMLSEAKNRNQEWEADPAVGRSHEDVMKAARKAIQ